MAGFLFPLLMDLMGGGLGGSTFGPAELSASAQDTSADSNVFNTQGPSANHGSISFNFHVNNENFTSPLGNKSKGSSNHQMDELTQQNELLKQIIGKIAPSIIPTGARKKRSIRPRRPWVRCFRPSRLCPPRHFGLFYATPKPLIDGPPLGLSNVSSNPLIHRPPIPILRAKQEYSKRIAGLLDDYYFEVYKEEKKNPLPKSFQLALSKYYGLKPLTDSLGNSNEIKPQIEIIEGK